MTTTAHSQDMITYNCVYNSTKRLLLKLLETNLPIVIYGKGGCGKTVLLNELYDKIEAKGYIVESDGKVTESLFNNKYIITLFDLDKIRMIDENKYYLINMNS